MTVQRVSGTWTAATGICSGTTWALVSNKPVATLGTANSLVSGAFTAGETRNLHLRRDPAHGYHQ